MKKSQIEIGKIFSNAKKYERYKERKITNIEAENVYYDEALFYVMATAYEGMYEANKRNQSTSLIAFQKWAKNIVEESKFEWTF